MTGFTKEEQDIMDSVVSAWNGFLALERQHPDEVNEFATSVHGLQYLLGMRILRREHSDIFPIKTKGKVK